MILIIWRENKPRFMTKLFCDVLHFVFGHAVRVRDRGTRISTRAGMRKNAQKLQVSHFCLSPAKNRRFPNFVWLQAFALA